MTARDPPSPTKTASAPASMYTHGLGSSYCLVGTDEPHDHHRSETTSSPAVERVVCFTRVLSSEAVQWALGWTNRHDRPGGASDVDGAVVSPQPDITRTDSVSNIQVPIRVLVHGTNNRSTDATRSTTSTSNSQSSRPDSTSTAYNTSVDDDTSFADSESAADSDLDHVAEHMSMGVILEPATASSHNPGARTA